MNIEICLEAVDLILDSIYSTGEQQQLLANFTIKNPEEKISFLYSGIGTTIYIRDDKSYLKAIVYIKKNGLSYLDELSIFEVRKLVTNFVIRNFWYIKDGELSRNHSISYRDQISDLPKINFAKALLKSDLFSVSNIIYLYPFNSIISKVKLKGSNFFILDAKDISLSDTSFENLKANIDFSKYPCLIDERRNSRLIRTWIGIKAPNEKTAAKILSSILGTLALFESSKKRYIFSGITPDTGCCYFSENSYTFRETEPNLPSLYYNLQVEHHLLGILNELDEVILNKIQGSKKISSLINFYKSWFEKDGERYRTLFSSVDSLLETKSNHSRVFTDFVINHTNNQFDNDRIRLLLSIRGDVVHGKSPNLYECRDYELYVEKYLSDPLHDIQDIVEICLKNFIFNIRD